MNKILILCYLLAIGFCASKFEQHGDEMMLFADEGTLYLQDGIVLADERFEMFVHFEKYKAIYGEYSFCVGSAICVVLFSTGRMQLVVPSYTIHKGSNTRIVMNPRETVWKSVITRFWHSLEAKMTIVYGAKESYVTLETDEDMYRMDFSELTLPIDNERAFFNVKENDGLLIIKESYFVTRM